MVLEPTLYPGSWVTVSVLNVEFLAQIVRHGTDGAGDFVIVKFYPDGEIGQLNVSMLKSTAIPKVIAWNPPKQP